MLAPITTASYTSKITQKEQIVAEGATKVRKIPLILYPRTVKLPQMPI